MATIEGTNLNVGETNRLRTTVNADATITLTTINEQGRAGTFGSWNSATLDLTVEAARELQYALAVFLAPHD